MTDQQLTRDDLAGMTPDEVDQAHRAGRCDALLGVPAEDVDVLGRARSDKPLTLADVAHLRRIGADALIVRAADAGRIATTKETK